MRLAFIALLALHLFTHTAVFEDGSYRMGILSGCIPGALCDTPYTDDCPPGLEDVECWEATR